MPTKDLVELTENCVRSILSKTDCENYEIIIVNNNSQQKETHTFFDEIQRESSRVSVINYNKAFNYSAINNQADKIAKGSVIGVINNDIETFNNGLLTEMLAHAIRPDIGCVGAKMYYPDNTIEHAGVILGFEGVARHSHK